VQAERHLTIDIGDLSVYHASGRHGAATQGIPECDRQCHQIYPGWRARDISGQKLLDEKLGDCVEIQVRDTGIGIDPDYLELIFEKFYQTGKGGAALHRKNDFQGWRPGLGLSIARGVIQAHGGRIWAESAGHDETTCPAAASTYCCP